MAAVDAVRCRLDTCWLNVSPEALGVPLPAAQHVPCFYREFSLLDYIRELDLVNRRVNLGFFLIFHFLLNLISAWVESLTAGTRRSH